MWFTECWDWFPKDAAYTMVDYGHSLQRRLEFFLRLCLFDIKGQKKKSCNSCDLKPDFFSLCREFNCDSKSLKLGPNKEFMVL